LRSRPRRSRGVYGRGWRRLHGRRPSRLGRPCMTVSRWTRARRSRQTCLSARNLRVIISLMCCRSVGRYVTLGASGVDAASLARTHVRAREEKAFPLPPAIGLPPRSRRGRA
jgi:hypothetical protein